MSGQWSPRPCNSANYCHIPSCTHSCEFSWLFTHLDLTPKDKTFRWDCSWCRKEGSLVQQEEDSLLFAAALDLPSQSGREATGNFSNTKTCHHLCFILLYCISKLLLCLARNTLSQSSPATDPSVDEINVSKCTGQYDLESMFWVWLWLSEWQF